MDIYFALIGMVLILPVACCGIRNLEKKKCNSNNIYSVSVSSNCVKGSKCG